MNINGQKVNRAGFSKTLCFMFSGSAFAGKSTCADILGGIAKSDSLVNDKFSLATKVKELAVQFGWDGKKDERGRALLQAIGNTARSYDQDVFARTLLERVEFSDSYPYDMICIDDWRFPNELSFIRNNLLYKPVTIRVLRPDAPIKLEGDLALDESERSLDNHEFDYVVENFEDSLDKLHNDLYDIYATEVLNNIRNRS
jgi:hypothetical protein